MFTAAHEFATLEFPAESPVQRVSWNNNMTLHTPARFPELYPPFSLTWDHAENMSASGLTVGGDFGERSVTRSSERAKESVRNIEAYSGSLGRDPDARSEAARYAATLLAVGDGLWEWQIASGRAYFNERYYALLGYQHNEFEASYAAWRQRVHPEDIRAAEAALRHSVVEGTGFEIQFRMHHKSGYWVWTVARGKVSEHDSAGRALTMVGTLTDVTARRQSEQALLDRQKALWLANSELTQILRAHTTALSAETANRQSAESELLKANEQLSVVAAACCRLAQDLTLAEQRERKRISRLLHDHLQQILAAAKVEISRAAAVAPHSMHEHLNETANLLAASLDISRSLSAELYPPALMVSGLKGGLEWLACWMHEKHRLRVSLKIRDPSPAIPCGHELILFDAVRELLFNVVKHAAVGSARVELRYTKQRQLKIEVSDCGLGFDPDVALRKGGTGLSLGLCAIRERVLSLGGSFVVHSTLGQGSCFTIIAPLGQATSA